MRRHVADHDGPYTMAETAEELRMSVKTRRGHCERREIRFFYKGRRQRMFERSDIEEFKSNGRERACQSGSRRARRTTGTTSGSKGVGFFGSTGTPKKSDAKDIEAAERARVVREQHYPAEATMTLDLAANRYWNEIAKRQASAETTDYQLANLVSRLGKPRYCAM